MSKISKISDIVEQTIIIPHFELIQRSERESLFRFFDRGNINGAVVRAVICICDESRITQELSLFDLALRMINSTESVSFSSSLQEIVSNAKKMMKYVDLTICYDTQSFPLRTVQRMFSTGRKHTVKDIFLMT